MDHRGVARLAALAIVALLRAAPALADVIDEIAFEKSGSTETVTLRLTGPVNYVRGYASGRGEIVNVYLQALAPLAPGKRLVPEEVKYSAGTDLVPPFTVRVSLDPRCEPVPSPVCLVIQFERAVRSRVRLGEDRRSLLLEFPPPKEKKHPGEGEKGG